MHDPIILVSPLPVGGWCVRLQGSEAKQIFADRYCALEYAHVWAQDTRPSRVCLTDGSGTIEDECTYGHFKEQRALAPVLAIAAG
ncbi:MAG TPA: hypothetical protein VJM53_10900 [Burkholderiales bacterium]|nr:hypothetical protein [Burkholderiales bacterium]